MLQCWEGRVKKPEGLTPRALSPFLRLGAKVCTTQHVTGTSQARPPLRQAEFTAAVTVPVAWVVGKLTRLNHAQPHLGHRAPIQANLDPQGWREGQGGRGKREQRPGLIDRRKEGKRDRGGRRRRGSRRRGRGRKQGGGGGARPPLDGVGHLGQVEGGNPTRSWICLIYFIILYQKQPISKASDVSTRDER